jgi:hypothetical protein
MKPLIFLIAFFFAMPTNADVHSMINNWKQLNNQVMDLKKKPEKYGLAPRGFYEIKYAAVTLQIAKDELNCNANNRKVCSNQLAANEVK